MQLLMKFANKYNKKTPKEIDLNSLFVWYQFALIGHFISFHVSKTQCYSSIYLTLAWNFNKSNTPPWVFSTIFKLYKWYQIA